MTSNDTISSTAITIKLQGITNLDYTRYPITFGVPWPNTRLTGFSEPLLFRGDYPTACLRVVRVVMKLLLSTLVCLR
jgi:hypothetical protein